MQSKAASVDAYLQEIPDERREIVTAIRAIVNRAAPRCRESMAYGMPSWDLGGHWIALGSQRHCLSLFVSDPELVLELASATGSRDFGMRCLRWPAARHVRLEGVRVLIETAAKRRTRLIAAGARHASASAKRATKAATASRVSASAARKHASKHALKRAAKPVTKASGARRKPVRAAGAKPAGRR